MQPKVDTRHQNMEKNPTSGDLPTKNGIPFSEALEKTGFGVFNYVLIFIGGLVLGNCLFETASGGYIILIAECDLQLTTGDKGILSTIGFIGIIVSSHLWGFLADTKGRRTVIVPTLLISFGVTLLSSLAHRFWLLALLRFINGFFISASSATIYVYIGEFHVDRTRYRAIMGASFVFSAVAMILPIMAWGVINQTWTLDIPFLGILYKPWRLFIVTCGSPGILCALILLLYPESPKFLLAIGENKKAIEVLKKIHRWNGGHGDLQIEEIILEKDITLQYYNEVFSKEVHFVRAFFNNMWNQTAPLFQGCLLRSTLLIFLIQFCMFVTIHGMYMWFPYISDTIVEYINDNPGNKSLLCNVIYDKQALVAKENNIQLCTEKLENRTYLYSLAIEVLSCVEFVIIGLLSNRFRKVHILFVILATCGVLAIASINLEDTSLALYTYVLIFISGVGIGVLGGITVELYPTHLRGMALCISLMFGRIGGVVGANTVRFLLTDNCELMFYISGFSMIISGFVAFLIPREFKSGNNDSPKEC